MIKYIDADGIPRKVYGDPVGTELRFGIEFVIIRRPSGSEITIAKDQIIMNTKHTSIPWHDEGGTIHSGKTHVAVALELRGETYRNNPVKRAREEQANAKIIVKAVNMHDEMLGVLEKAYAVLTHDLMSDEFGVIGDFDLVVKAMITQAKGATS